MSIIQGTSKAAGGAGYEIDQSIRFNKTDNSGLTVTPSAGNRDLFTLSVWFKLGLVTSTEYRTLFCADTSNTFQITFLPTANGDYLRFQDNGVRIFDFSQSLRDPSAWYHLVYAYDSAQATAADRCKAYLNGEEVTDLTGVAYPAQNVDSKWNSAVVHGIGYRSATDNWDGYLSEINHIEGAALDPTSFGETNADTGQWTPVKYAGSYGTNGFYITGSNSADLGADNSGNGNNFTSSGLAAADQVTDSPTDNFCTLSPIDKNSNFTLSDGNLTNSNGTNAHAACFSTIAFDASDTDGWYWEVDCDSFASTGFAVLIADEAVNQTDITTDPYTQPAEGNLWAHRRYNSASDGAITGVGSTGSWTSYGPAAVNGDVIGYCVKNGKLFIAINNTWLESSNPATEANPAFSNLTGNLRVGVNRFADTGTDTTTLNFGQTGFTYTPPTGAKAISTANLPDPTIADPSAYFQTTTYAGTGSTRSVDQSGNSTFEPGFVWIKARDAAYDHALYDQVRGATEELKSNASSAESTISTGLTAFESDGFQVGSRLGVNDGTKNFVAWQWKAAGSGSSNTDGSITSTVSANTTSGFSIVQYTGNATATQTVGHGLGVTPGMVIIKKTSASGNNWQVWHQNLSATSGKLIELNTTTAEQSSTTIFETAPTSSVFGIGSAAAVNASSATFIAYCFAEVEGFSKFTSYEGNASTDGPFIYCGFRPSFVMIKNADNGTESWWIQDAAREPFNDGNMARLAPDSSAAEADNVPWFDFVSNGLKVRYNAGGINSSGTHIVMAFASSPFKTATAQ